MLDGLSEGEAAGTRNPQEGPINGERGGGEYMLILYSGRSLPPVPCQNHLPKKSEHSLTVISSALLQEIANKETKK